MNERKTNIQRIKHEQNKQSKTDIIHKVLS